jgi:hypothetical protein
MLLAKVNGNSGNAKGHPAEPVLIRETVTFNSIALAILLASIISLFHQRMVIPLTNLN